MDDQRGAHVLGDAGRFRGAFRGVGGDADVEGLALADQCVEGADGFLDRRIGVRAVRVEDVHVVQAHARQRLVGRGKDVLARSQVPVGSGPHVPAGLRGNDEFVAVGLEVPAHHAAEVLLGRPVRRAVVVGQVEVDDAVVKRVAQYLALGVEGAVVAEVPPQAEADRGQDQAGMSRPAVACRCVAVRRGNVRLVCFGNGGVAELFGHGGGVLLHLAIMRGILPSSILVAPARGVHIKTAVCAKSCVNLFDRGSFSGMRSGGAFPGKPGGAALKVKNRS